MLVFHVRLLGELARMWRVAQEGLLSLLLGSALWKQRARKKAGLDKPRSQAVVQLPPRPLTVTCGAAVGLATPWKDCDFSAEPSARGWQQRVVWWLVSLQLGVYVLPSWRGYGQGIATITVVGISPSNVSQFYSVNKPNQLSKSLLKDDLCNLWWKQQNVNFCV